MRWPVFAWYMLASAAMTSWAQAMPPADLSRHDIHSFGNPDEVKLRHIDLDLLVDFDRKQLAGLATLRFDRMPGSPHDARLVLDSRGLNVDSMLLGLDDGGVARVTPTLGPDDPILGRSISIPLPAKADRVWIRYHTSPTAGALQWLDAPRTAGGKQPFLFTQSQAIQARTWIPTQDSPGVRVTYDARITVPAGLKAVMSADAVASTEPNVFKFAMPQPVPSYLIALAVGDLAFLPIGPRTGVWAEPSVVAKAAYEFVDTEKMVEVAEKRFGPYRWGRYDLLVLPPSFPFGGMENPKLTFATPTVLAGDRSLVSLVAHELAHSWSGNLVTNATWRDFWLNEGFTNYLERRIVEDVHGPDRAGIERVLGLQELRDELSRLPSNDQVLHVDLNGRDPDDGMTRIPYEKGSLFLDQLEIAFGRDRFDAFLRGYFDAHAFQSITTADFTDYLKAKLFPLDSKAAASIDLDAWIEQPGLKAAFFEPKSDRLTAVDKAANDWVGGKVAASSLKTADWTTQEWQRFLRAVPEETSNDRLAELDAAFKLTDRGNSEVAGQWLVMAIRGKYHPADARLESFLTSIGRRKFLIPLYRELIMTPEGSAKAKAIYTKARPFYHPIAVDSVDKLLGWPK